MGKGRYFFYLSNLIDVKKVLVYLKQQAALRNAETLEGCLFIADYVIKYTLKYFSKTFEEEIGFFHAEAEGWTAGPVCYNWHLFHLLTQTLTSRGSESPGMSSVRPLRGRREIGHFG